MGAELTEERNNLDAQLEADAKKDEEQNSAIEKLKAQAAEHAAELDELEKKCVELSADLSEKESKLADAQEMERKCSREYIAYEKHRAKKGKMDEKESTRGTHRGSWVAPKSP